MPRNLDQAVVVITGATSGIGRATALRFAEGGSSLVLVSRQEDALREIVAQCEEQGVQAIGVQADVAGASAVDAIGQRAVERFGRVDVWVNNASVTMFGKFDEVPLEDFRRVLDINVFGYIHGARTALALFKKQGQGVLVDVASVVATMPQPYTSAYTMSKHAVRALGMSIRQELALEGAKDIHVCTVLPASMDTPIFQHAANYTGQQPKPMAPVYDPDEVAQTIVRMAEHPKREVYVGTAGHLVDVAMKLAPGMTERVAATMTHRDHFTDKPEPPTTGNLYEPMPGWNEVRGGWREEGADAAPVPRLALAVSAAVPALLLARKVQQRRRERRRSRTERIVDRLEQARHVLEEPISRLSDAVEHPAGHATWRKTR
jgi:short-subunit dehydrogenase